MSESVFPSASVVDTDSAEHPFFPINVRVPGFVATSIPTGALLTIFFGSLAAIVVSTRAFLKRSKIVLSSGDVWTVTWFILCGFIHSFFEGYFSYNSLNMGSRTDLFGQLWKEYALSDSRYMTQDSFVVCMESVTACFWGPLSFLCAYYIITDSSVRQPLQLIISLGQMYGLVLYYATCAFEEVVHGVILSRPERIYYCAYYILCNVFWLLIPGLLMYQSVRETSQAFTKVKSASAMRKG